MQIKLISVLKCVFPLKNNRYKVDMGVINEPIKSFYMSEKQWFRLADCFNYDDHPTYSTKRKMVYGVFDGTKFVWCGNRNNLEWMSIKFNAIVD
jgi:hypothetical protein